MAKMRKFSDGGETGLQKETFGEAFKRNRAKGEKTFEFNGKKYTTETKEEAAGRKSADLDKKPNESAAETARLSRVPKASSAEMESRSKREKEQAVESVNPEDYIGVGAALKALPKLAARVATKAAPKSAAKRVEPDLANPKRAPRDMDESRFADEGNPNFKRGGKVKKMASGGKVRSASSRADGCAIRGKTRA